MLQDELFVGAEEPDGGATPFDDAAPDDDQEILPDASPSPEDQPNDPEEPAQEEAGDETALQIGAGTVLDDGEGGTNEDSETIDADAEEIGIPDLGDIEFVDAVVEDAGEGQWPLA